MFLGRKLAGPSDNLRLQRQHGLQRDRQMAQVAQRRSFRIGRQAPAHFRQRQRQHEQGRELRRKRLGRCHADFDAGAGQITELGQAHDRARSDVANRERLRHAQRLRVFQRGKRIRRFA